jgi:2-polyprenyl-6-methoxyphenol hydroxylase-like FAD-dependent oxidoreductase
MPQQPEQSKKRVLIVGAGAAGMACADSLAAHPDRFEVTMVESQVCLGPILSFPWWLTRSRVGVLRRADV